MATSLDLPNSDAHEIWGSTGRTRLTVDTEHLRGVFWARSARGAGLSDLMASIGGEGSGPGGHRLHLAHVMGLCDPCVSWREFFSSLFGQFCVVVWCLAGASSAQVFHQSVRGCAKGSQCGFCHLPHQHDPDGVRPKKTRRQRIKNEVLELLVSKGPEDLHAALQEDARKHPYVP